MVLPLDPRTSKRLLQVCVVHVPMQFAAARRPVLVTNDFALQLQRGDGETAPEIRDVVMDPETEIPETVFFFLSKYACWMRVNISIPPLSIWSRSQGLHRPFPNSAQ